MTDKEKAYLWFLLGFAQSGEGFNADCTFSHLAPRNAQTFGDGQTIEEPPDELSDLFEQFWEEES